MPWLPQKAYILLGACLAEARHEAGVTQAELAAQLRKPQSFVSAFERGQRRIDLLEFVVVLDAISADVDEVLRRVLAAAGGTLPLRKKRRATRGG